MLWQPRQEVRVGVDDPVAVSVTEAADDGSVASTMFAVEALPVGVLLPEGQDLGANPCLKGGVDHCGGTAASPAGVVVSVRRSMNTATRSFSRGVPQRQTNRTPSSMK